MEKFKKVLLLLTILAINNYAQSFSLMSPDESVIVNITNDSQLKYSLTFNNQLILENSAIAIEVDNKVYPNSKVVENNLEKIEKTFEPVVPRKTKIVQDVCNEITLRFENNVDLIFRAYDNGFAYRISTDFGKEVIVQNETVDLKFSQNYKTLFPEEENLISHYERLYKNIPLDSITAERFCSLPMVVECNDEVKLGITESSLYDYPNLFLQGREGNSLHSKFPNHVKNVEDVNDRVEKVYNDNFIAFTNGSREFPWRIFMLSKNDGELITNQLVDILSDENVIENTDWIKPGKVAWDWWNANNIYGVNFKSGINTDTYKYYIDFASEYGLDYIILDEGWSKTTTNIMEPNDSLDIKELLKYGKDKNVGIILWTLWKPLSKNLIEILDLYESLGVKGIKVDFMQRADQEMVNYYEKVLVEAAKRKLLVDYHGAFKPAGFARKYPNYISNEGVQGLEQCKWSANITPDHDCTLPFTRMLAGAMDYTPGAMINANKINYKDIFERPMSQGTRAHQIALYTIFESPLQMLADNPSNYYANKSSAEFISKIPTIWDDMKVLDGKIGDYVIIARKKNNIWYLSGITDWKERDFTIKLDFLDINNYKMQLVTDGINADRYASDVKFESSDVTNKSEIKVHLAPGGGFSAIIIPE